VKERPGRQGIALEEPDIAHEALKTYCLTLGARWTMDQVLPLEADHPECNYPEFRSMIPILGAPRPQRHWRLFRKYGTVG